MCLALQTRLTHHLRKQTRIAIYREVKPSSFFTRHRHSSTIPGFISSPTSSSYAGFFTTSTVHDAKSANQEENSKGYTRQYFVAMYCKCTELFKSDLYGVTTVGVGGEGEAALIFPVTMRTRRGHKVDRVVN